MRTPDSRTSAFTIVELLVVIAVISVLMGLLLPALSGVRRQSAKNSELSSIKQVYHAWQMYGNNNNDAVLPGYLSINVQKPRVPNVSNGWGVKYDFPTPPQSQGSEKAIPPAPTYNGTDNFAGPWTWRLLPYLDFNHQTVHGYSNDEDGIIEMVEEPGEIAEEPAFGYNGFYIGGYWDKEVAIDGVITHFHRYYDHVGVADGRRLTVPLGIGQIRNSSKMVTFCSTSRFEATGFQGKFPSDIAGGHLATPPFVEEAQRWRPDQADPTALWIDTANATDPTFAPIGRHTGYTAILWADGHADSQAANALDDQRLWINSASAKNYTHKAP